MNSILLYNRLIIFFLYGPFPLILSIFAKLSPSNLLIFFSFLNDLTFQYIIHLIFMNKTQSIALFRIGYLNILLKFLSFEDNFLNN